MRRNRHRLIVAGLLLLPGCFARRSVPFDHFVPPAMLLREDFEGENDNRYQLNYDRFEQWEVVQGTVDLVGKPPYDDFLPRAQGMYVDLDGSMQAAGTLRSRRRFTLTPGTYQLVFRMAGTPRDNQPANTVIVSVGDAFRERITLSSHVPLETYERTFRVERRTEAHLTFHHLGGDDYGIFIDDILFVRL